MTAWPIREARSGLGLNRRSLTAWIRDFVVAALVGAWLGVLGPFGNYGAGPLDVRITFQLLMAVVSVAAFGITIRMAVRGGRRIGIPPWISAPASVAATCLPLSAVVAWVGIALFPQLKRMLSPLDWCVETLVLVSPIVCGYAGLLHLISRRSPVAPAKVGASSQSAPASIERPRLGARLGLRCSGDILALKVEDHYVRIYTASGSQLVLMRLSDAVAEMDGIEGLKVHRSWWIARRAVGDVRLGRRGGRLTLCNGLQAPIARSALGSVRAAGWS